MTRISSQAPRVVLDTNVVLSALVFRSGVAGALRRAWQEKMCHPLVSAATTKELLRALAYPKFRLTADEQHELLADYLPYATTIDTSRLAKMPVHTLPVCRDPSDTPFLQLAIAGKAHALVSDDKDLLVLSDQFAIPILTLDAFLKPLKSVTK